MEVERALPNEERAIVSYYSSHVDYRLFQSVMVSNMKKANKQNIFPPPTTYSEYLLPLIRS